MTTRLYLGIEPNRLSAVLVERSRWRKRVTKISHALILEGQPENTLNAPALDAYRARAQSLIVTVSNTLCLYGVFARPQGLRNTRELEEFARMRMLERFGDSLHACRIQISAQGFTSHDVVCAINEPLLQNIGRLATHLKLPIHSLQPYGIRELHNQIMPTSLTWFVTLERDSGSLFVWKQDELVEIRTFQATDPGWTYPMLHRQINRDAIRLGFDNHATGYIGGSIHLQERALPPTINADITEFRGQDTSWKKDFRMALSPLWPRSAIR